MSLPYACDCNRTTANSWNTYTVEGVVYHTEYSGDWWEAFTDCIPNKPVTPIPPELNGFSEPLARLLMDENQPSFAYLLTKARKQPGGCYV